MRICMIAEGCYPFVPGGVSSWLQELILNMPEHEFVVWAIGAQEKMRGHYCYPIPSNVVQVQDVYLDTVLSEGLQSRKSGYHLSKNEWQEVRKLLSCKNPDWGVIYNCFVKNDVQPAAFLLDRAFLDIIKSLCAEEFPYISFSDYFWTLRSMFLPLLYLLSSPIPEADLYHSVSAGYAGVLGAMAALKYNRPYVLTEHGIYTREREEEILRSNWVKPHFKDLWINMFYMFTRCAYQSADCVTSLFHRASLIQQEIGCAAEKCSVISNGVHVERFAKVPKKTPNGLVDIGAIVRVVPIKDIKTMLYAFALVEEQKPNVRLHIMGNTAEDEEYYQECVELTNELRLQNVLFLGRVNVAEYLQNVDFTLLTSISEGQPLAVLEAMAAGRPSITTDVGSCRELLEGVSDDFGLAGLCVPVMHQSALAEAILKLCNDPKLLESMRENGLKRVNTLYTHQKMMEAYRNTYDCAIKAVQARGGGSNGGHRL
ncbi:MAG: GT4 family glycosyltransferase PelF [Clostridia bacterium]